MEAPLLLGSELSLSEGLWPILRAGESGDVSDVNVNEGVGPLKDESKRLSQSWDDYAPWIRAIFDEYARALRDLKGVVSAIPADRFAGSTALADEEFPNIRAIMWHVIGAANRYADYLESALDATDVTRREHTYRYETPDEALSSLGQALERTVTVMAKCQGRSEEALAALQIRTRWEQIYDIEQMLEHAIVHILRHRRQIERWLALPIIT